MMSMWYTGGGGVARAVPSIYFVSSQPHFD